MTFYNTTTDKYYRGGALKTAEGTIFNPREETLAKYGYGPYTPPPPPPPQPMTDEEISQMRQAAYVAECDPYLVAYQGYLVEGDAEKAESARKAYLKAKAEVRKRLPYAE